ncbi:response regulator [Rhodohalobacter halophilus]|uniref:response regulator n=1 Tax=Rhodohalobacter halophilus TaxID=1812810 RepID=UPI00083FAFB3|nr:response regulator [Rhodohalobacter halophilus]
MKRVLIVEDDLIISLTTEKMVEKLGYQVVGSVTSGEEAVRAAQENQPDVILMDIRLNGSMDGIEATQEILNRMNNIRVIYVTGNTDQAYRERAEKTGYEAYLIKPLRMEDLKSII